MRRLIRFFVPVATALVALHGCAQKDNPDPDPVPDPAPTAITLSKSSLSAEAAGGSFDITVKSPFSPQVEAPSWVTVKKGTIKDYSLTVTLEVAANTLYEDRSATLTFKATGASSATLSLTQAAAPEPEEPEEGDITTTLVTENPTTEVQALYKYLYDLYGKKTLSAVIANVNWNHKEADKVYALTGKYPAMNCYDFIHIYVPQNNWINYSDLTPVTEWADAGGIVSLMWHFNVPLNKDTQPGADGSGVTCSPDKTTFTAANALTEGTWENAWFYGQMEKVAAILLQLQEKGIAAIWRPFHEAAGNATLKSGASWGKAWFWWGYGGADTFKKLWVAMFDYFKAKGIKNLIWVWTTQNYNGDSSQYNQDKDWYPGNAYVDIVARDLYGYTAAQNKTEFTQIQSTYPTKMVTLGECGKNGDTAFASIPGVWDAGAKWSWFMPWYGDSMPADSWWKEAMSNASVLSREDVNY